MMPRRVSLVRNLPPVLDAQSCDGACTAHAVVALVEYYMDCRIRLSVAFLYAAMRLKVRDWLVRNMSAVMDGGRGEDDFESVFGPNLVGLRCVLKSNAPDSPSAMRYGEMFREKAFAVFGVSRGCPVRFASEALVEYGICRHVLWPEGGDSSVKAFAGDMPILPDAVQEDARRRRMVGGLDFLPEPGNVESVKAVLAGEGGHRPMPVVAALDAYPDGRGAHTVLVVGYRNDDAIPGGGEFLVRDGTGGGERMRIGYEFLSAHCTEAATLIQNMVDYVGDGYGGFRKWRKIRRAISIAVLAALLAGGAWGWHAWRTSSAVVDAPFGWLANPQIDMEHITVVGDATYGSCFTTPQSLQHQFFRSEKLACVSMSFNTNGIASATASRPDILLVFARSTTGYCSDADKKALERYVLDGGTAFVFVCNCNRALMADLLAPYGLKIQSLPGRPPLRAVAPLLRDFQLDGFSYFRITEMSDAWHVMIVTDDGEASPVMAFRRVGNGKLFCAAQQSIGLLGGRRCRNMEWWGRLLFACVADAECR